MSEEEDKKYLIELGKKIKSLREANGLNKSKVARGIDVDRATIIRMENGSVKSSITTLRNLASVLGVSIGELVTV